MTDAASTDRRAATELSVSPGSPEGYARATADSWPRMLARLERGLLADATGGV